MELIPITTKNVVFFIYSCFRTAVVQSRAQTPALKIITILHRNDRRTDICTSIDANVAPLLYH